MQNIVCKKVKIRDNGNCHVLIYDVDGPIKEDGVNQNCQNIREGEEKLSCKPTIVLIVLLSVVSGSAKRIRSIE